MEMTKYKPKHLAQKSIGDGTYRVYIAGPFTGLPNCNLAAFAWAERHLYSFGYMVFNPTFPWIRYPKYNPEDPMPVHLRRNIIELLKCDCVAVLPGYHGSFAEVELSIAYGLEMPVFYLQEGFCVRRSHSPGIESGGLLGVSQQLSLS